MKNPINHRNLAVVAVGSMLFTGLTFTTQAHANAVDDAADACVEAARLIREDDDLDGALEEANWCITGLRQLKEEIKLSLLPDELEGFEGGEIQNQNVMGMNITERKYTRDGESIELTLTTTGASDGGAMGALGELTKMFGGAAAMGAAASGGKKIRVQKRTVIASDENGKGILNVELKSGGNLQLESRDLDSDELVDFLREFPLRDLDESLSQ